MLSRANRGDVTGRTCADNDDIELSAHYFSLWNLVRAQTGLWSDLQQQAGGVFERLFDRDEELYGLAAVDDPVIISQRHVHHGPSHDVIVNDLWPLPEEVAAAALGGCRRTVVVEQNYTSQLAKLLRMTTGIQVDQTLNKYDGRPFAPEEIIAGLSKEVASGHAA